MPPRNGRRLGRATRVTGEAFFMSDVRVQWQRRGREHFIAASNRPESGVAIRGDVFSAFACKLPRDRNPTPRGARKRAHTPERATDGRLTSSGLERESLTRTRF